MMLTEILLFFIHLIIISIATMVSIRIFWEKNNPLKMYALIVPSLIYMAFIGFLIGN